MDRHFLYEALAYFVSGLAHVGIFGALAVVGNSDPVPWTTRPGRASIALSASMAASPRPQNVTELDLPISVELSRATVGTKQLIQTLALLERKVPNLEVGPRLELPTPHGTRRPVAPAAGKDKKEEAAHDPRAKKTEDALRPATRPAVVEPEAKLAAMASPASAASRASAGTEKVVLPQSAHTNPEPVYPSEAQAAGQQGVVKVLVTVTTSGTAAAVRVWQSSGFPALDASALATVRNWRFEPGRRAGHAVTMDVTVPIRFSIRVRN